MYLPICRRCRSFLPNCTLRISHKLLFFIRWTSTGGFLVTVGQHTEDGSAAMESRHQRENSHTLLAVKWIVTANVWSLVNPSSVIFNLLVVSAGVLDWYLTSHAFGRMIGYIVCGFYGTDLGLAVSVIQYVSWALSLPSLDRLNLVCRVICKVPV